jgi:hypothetical protein
VFDSTIFTGPVANYPVADSFNRKLEHVVSSGNIPHNFVFSSTYAFPIGSGYHFFEKGADGIVIQPWDSN